MASGSATLTGSERAFNGNVVSQDRQAFPGELLGRLDAMGADGFTFHIDTILVQQHTEQWHVHCIFALIEETSGPQG